jgi:hypothetical protein
LQALGTSTKARGKGIKIPTASNRILHDRGLDVKTWNDKVMRPAIEYLGTRADPWLSDITLHVPFLQGLVTGAYGERDDLNMSLLDGDSRAQHDLLRLVRLSSVPWPRFQELIPFSSSSVSVSIGAASLMWRRRSLENA